MKYIVDWNGKEGIDFEIYVEYFKNFMEYFYSFVIWFVDEVMVKYEKFLSDVVYME